MTSIKALRGVEFADGGAFPEVLFPQYPLGMGKHSKKIVCSRHTDLIPKILKYKSESNEDEEEKRIHEETKAALYKIVNATQPKQSNYISYKPSQQGDKERLVRMVEMPVDPLDPPKFKHKKIPRPYSDSPPVPVMHSPPRPVSVKDQQDWKIPPCISNWKNAKGYTIPLEKRLALQHDVQISDDFVKLSETLYVAEQKSREAVTMRSKVHTEMAMREKERKEQELSALAQRARSEAAVMPREEEREEGVVMRQRIREERRRERGRERMFEGEDGKRKKSKITRDRGRERMFEGEDGKRKKSKITRDRDRCSSEKIALGMASTGGSGGQVMYDQRLFNQEQGMMQSTDDDQYNVYDTAAGLFGVQPTLSTLYKPKKDMDTMECIGMQTRTLERFKPK